MKPQASRGSGAFIPPPPATPPRNFLDFNFLKSSFLGVWVVQTGYWPVASSILLGWSLANRLIISWRSISTQWIWSKASPSHFQISTVEADVNLRLLSYRTAYRPQWNLFKWNCSGSHCSGVGYHRKCWSSAFFWMFKPYEFEQRLKRVNHMWQDNIQNPNATQYCSTVTIK